jgi:hypothetical protein
MALSPAPTQPPAQRCHRVLHQLCEHLGPQQGQAEEPLRAVSAAAGPRAAVALHSGSATGAGGGAGTSSRQWADFGIGSYGGPGTTPPSAVDKASWIEPSRHRTLFIDDTAVESMTGLVRTLHQPRKCGAVVVPASATAGRFSNVDACKG